MNDLKRLESLKKLNDLEMEHSSCKFEFQRSQDRLESIVHEIDEVTKSLYGKFLSEMTPGDWTRFYRELQDAKVFGPDLSSGQVSSDQLTNLEPVRLDLSGMPVTRDQAVAIARFQICQDCGGLNDPKTDCSSCTKTVPESAIESVLQNTITPTGKSDAGLTPRPEEILTGKKS